MTYIDEEIIDAITSVYVMKKLEDRSFSFTNEDNDNLFYKKMLMLSSDQDNHLMIACNGYDIKLFIHVYKNVDDNIIQLMENYKQQYDSKYAIINEYIYYYEFIFKDIELFNDFFKKNIFPLMGIVASENIFSWI